MKVSELRELSPEELGQRLKGIKRELFDLRMQKAGGKLSTPHKIKQIRRDAARILTLIQEATSEESK